MPFGFYHGATAIVTESTEKLSKVVKALITSGALCVPLLFLRALHG